MQELLQDIQLYFYALMNQPLVLFIVLLIAFLTSKLAKYLNRNDVFWGALGFFFGVFPAIILLFLGKNKVKS